MLPIFLRRHTMLLLESVAKHTLAGKARAVADLLGGQVGIFEQITGRGHASADHIFMGTIPRFLPEYSNEMIGTHARHSRQLLDGNILRKMLIDKGDGSLCLIGMSAKTAVLWIIQKQLSENIREILGQQRLTDACVAGEHLKDRCHLLQHDGRILHGEYIAHTGCDLLIIFPGQRTVKVYPQAFVTGNGRITMRLIAVDQDKGIFGNRLQPASKIELHGPFLDVHQQKAVKGSARKVIARFICKHPTLQWIEEELLCCFAGCVNEIL